MRVKLEEKMLDDGRVRQIVMYRKHWWSSWKPFLNDDGDLVVNYGFLNEEQVRIANLLGVVKVTNRFSKEVYDARLSMVEMVLKSDNVYVGTYDEVSGYSMAYDTPTCSVEDLQDLETKEK